MHIHSLRLHNYGRFQDKHFSFAEPGKLSLVYGPNEAGKSTALFALEAFLFGFMHQTTAVSYEKAWAKSQLKVTGWLSASGVPDDVAELLRSFRGPSDRTKLGREDWLPSKGQRDMFRELFALDGERLRKQAERVLAADSDVGQALGAALLGEQVEKQCKLLEGDSNTLFTKQGRIQVIPTLRKELADLDDKIREQALRGPVWEAQERASKQAAQRAEDLTQERQATLNEQAILERDAKRLEERAELEALHAQLFDLQAQHAGLPLLTSEALATVEQLDKDLTALDGEIKQQRANHQQHQEDREKLSLNDDLWRLHQRLFDVDGEGLNQIGQKLSDWRALQKTRPSEAGQPGDKAEQQQTNLRAQEAGLARLQAALEALSDLPQEPSRPSLPPTLASLSFQQVSALLQPDVALSERLKSWRSQRGHQTQEAMEIDTQLRAAKQALEAAEIVCQQLQDQGAGLDSEQLTEARRQREQLWDDLKRDLGNAAIQRAFEQAQMDADRQADAFARSEKHAGAWQSALDRQSAAQLQVTACEKRHVDLLRQEAALLAELEALLQESQTAADDHQQLAQSLDHGLNLLAEVLAFAPQLRAWQQKHQDWRSQAHSWQSLAHDAANLGFDLAAGAGQLRAWHKKQQQALQDLKQAEAARQRWQQYQQRLEAHEKTLKALAAHAAEINIGLGLEPAAALDILQEVFLEEKQARDQRARLQLAIERVERDLATQTDRQEQLSEKRSAVLAKDWRDLGLLRGASQLQARILEKQAKLAALGAHEKWHEAEAIADARERLGQRYQQQDQALREAHTAAGVESQALKTLKQDRGARDLRFERAAKLAALRQAVEQYLDLGLQARVLRTALNRFLEQQQDALLVAASRTFTSLTDGAYHEINQRRDDDGKVHFWTIDNLGDDKDLGALSEGTKDQLFLSLRLAALDQYGLDQLRTPAGALPLICDDLLVQYDDTRAARALAVLADRRQRQQVIYFTHHRHLLELAEQHLTPESYEVLDLTLAA